ncbi:MAG: toxin-antitoxin system YwqK family antitoxin [Bernardetiaceae bacterium]
MKYWMFYRCFCVFLLITLRGFAGQAQEDTLRVSSDSLVATDGLFASIDKPVIDLIEQNKLAPRKGGVLGSLFKGGKDPLAEEDNATGKKGKKIKKKKGKKNTYEGLTVKRFFTRRLEGGKQVEEVFFCVEDRTLNTDPYVDNVRYFSEKEKKIIKDSRYQPDKGILLHGMYEQYVDGNLMQSGFYYKGLQHGRWETYTKKGTFKEKEEFYRGWYRSTQFTYYDAARKKLKSAISYKDGLADGYAVYVYPSGRVAERGYYKYGQKIYRWVAYFDRDGMYNRKQETQYDSQPFTDFEPYIRRQWDERGKLVIDATKK